MVWDKDSSSENFNMEDFIKEVRNWPELWDFTHDNYGNRIHKKIAWESVIGKFVTNFEGMSVAEKNYIVFSIMTYVRDKDIETLIEEIEKRPALYDKSLEDYTNVVVKKQLWEEICPILVKDWNNLSGENQTRAVFEVQKKWQSLRNCFARELRNQKAVISGMKSKKRRKYIYFDNLLFLLPILESRAPPSNFNENTEDDEHGQGDDDPLEIRGNKVETGERTEVMSKTVFEQPLSNTLLDISKSYQESRKEENEDVHYALSLVPALSSLNEVEKIEAKIKILSVLKSFKSSDSSNLQPPLPSRSIASSSHHTPSIRPPAEPSLEEFEDYFDSNESDDIIPSSSPSKTLSGIDSNYTQLVCAETFG